LNAAYVFGNLGNVASALGSGWSVEDAFAWAIDDESDLVLEIPAVNGPCELRFDIHPALFPNAVERQRLTVLSAGVTLGSFEMTGRRTISVPLPADMTRGKDRLALRLLHPDAARPFDHLRLNDRRRLALCFHSGTFAAVRPGGHQGGRNAASAPLEPAFAVFAGDATAMRLSEIVGRLPSLVGRLGVRFIDLSVPLDDSLGRLPEGALDRPGLCWIEMNAGTPATRDLLPNRLPARWTAARFRTPTARALWPFLGNDPRAVPEPGRYLSARYPFGDRLAMPLASMNMPDDVVYLMYEMSAEQEPIDLEDLFASDLHRWRNGDAKSDMRLADFMERTIGTNRLFISPRLPGPDLIREMARQALDQPLIRDLARPGTVFGELDALMDGYVGWQEELPVHGRVARHFGLSWWSPDLKYRWMNNARTYREYTLDTIRWVQWRT
jgi:hypothetical protein